MALAHPARDQLRVLRTEVDNENKVKARRITTGALQEDTSGRRVGSMLEGMHYTGNKLDDLVVAMGGRVAEEIVRGTALRDDLEARVLEEAGDAFPQQDRVVGEDYAHAPEASPGRAERREAGRQPGYVELEEPFPAIQARKLVLAEVLEVVGGVERVAGPLGQENLPSAPRLGDPGSAMNVEPEVGVVADVRLAGVHPHAHADLDALGQAVAGEGLLRGDGCPGSRARILEDDEELVAAVVDEVLLDVSHHFQRELGGEDAGVLALILLEDVGLHRAAHPLHHLGHRHPRPAAEGELRVAPPAAQVAGGEPDEHARLPGVARLALHRVEDFVDGYQSFYYRGKATTRP